MGERSVAGSLTSQSTPQRAERKTSLNPSTDGYQPLTSSGVQDGLTPSTPFGGDARSEATPAVPQHGLPDQRQSLPELLSKPEVPELQLPEPGIELDGDSPSTQPLETPMAADFEQPDLDWAPGFEPSAGGADLSEPVVDADGVRVDLEFGSASGYQSEGVRVATDLGSMLDDVGSGLTGEGFAYEWYGHPV